MPQENLLVTGATGFIGTHVLKKLIADNCYQIITIVRKDRHTQAIAELRKNNVVVFEGSFFSKNLLDRIFVSFPISYIMHLAAVRGVGNGPHDEYHTTNVLGTETLLETSLINHVKKFIFCSSVGVFGTIPCELPAHVTTPMHGDNNYHQSKILAEGKVQEFINRGLNAFIIRPSITYGSGDRGFSATLVQLVQKRMLLLPRTNNTIHLLDVNSLADLFLNILKNNNLPHRTYHAADEASIPLRELVNLIHYHFYKKDYPSFLTAPDYFFKLLHFFFSLTGNKKWLTRMALLYKSWHYDINQTINTFSWKPSRTRKAFLKNMDI